MPKPIPAVLAKEIMSMIAGAAGAASRASIAFDELKRQAEETSEAMGAVGALYAALISTAQSGLPVDDGLSEARALSSRTSGYFADLHRIFSTATGLMDQAVVQLAAAKASWRDLQADQADW